MIMALTSYKIRASLLIRASLPALFAVLFIFSFCRPAFADLPVNYVSSISVNGSPVRLAVDPVGIIYVTAPAAGKVFKFYRDGSPAGVITASQKPLSVAVDSTGKVFIGDSIERSVRVLGPDGNTLYSLGRGKNEFGMPGDIAVSSSGLVYVTDSSGNVVKIYNPDGSRRSSFGGYGTNPGQMIFPAGICLDENNNDVYVVDQTNGRVEVFDLDGNFKRSFGSLGSGDGQLTRGQGIHVANGKVYVSDAYLSVVEVFDTAGNFVSFIGSYGIDPGELKIPMDALMIGTNIYVANSDNARIEIFDVVDPLGIKVDPVKLSFAAYAGANPSPQTVQIDPEVAGAQVPWTATVFGSLALDVSASAGTTPSQVTVGINVAGLAVGEYQGAVIFHADGNDYPVTVNIAVSEPQVQLHVSPTSISLSYQSGALGSQAISASAEGGAPSWFAATDASWLTVSPTAGTTPGSVVASLNQDVASLAAGTYNANITVTAPGAAGSPATIPVTLTVTCPAITITPSTIPSGTSGTSYSQTFTQTGGVGTVTFSESGELPSGMTFSGGVLYGVPAQTGIFPITVTATSQNGCAGSTTVTIAVQQKPLIIVSPGSIDMSHQISGDFATGTFTVESSREALSWSATAGTTWLSLEPSSGKTPAVVTVALNSAADALSEGDYTASLTVASPDASNGPLSVLIRLKVVRAGSLLVTSNLDDASFTVTSLTTNPPLTFRGGGVSWRSDELKPGRYAIHFDHIKGYRRPGDRTISIVTGQTVTINAQYIPLPVADVIAAAKGPDPKNDSTIRVLDLNGGLINEFMALNTKYGARVAMADIDGDGVDEIIVSPGEGFGNRAALRIFRYDGLLVTEVPQVAGTLYGATIAAGDIDGDGTAEVAMGMVDQNGAQNIIVYSFDGKSLVQKTKISLKEKAAYPPAIAFGDFDGDGRLELVCISANKARVYAFYDGLLGAHVVASGAIPNLASNVRLTVAAVDIDGDGSDEMMIGYGSGVSSMVRVFNGDFTPVGGAIKVFNNGSGMLSPTLSSMDIDGDGSAEVLVSLSAKPANNSVVRIYDSNGIMIDEIGVFNSRYGVNATFGTIGTMGTNHGK